MLWSKEKFLVI